MSSLHQKAGPMYRDRLSQWQQSAYDPSEPETADSIRRSLEFNRVERAMHLEAIWNAGEDELFDRLFLQFYREDRGIVNAMTTRAASKALFRAYKLGSAQVS